jgi:hypothetical protein
MTLGSPFTGLGLKDAGFGRHRTQNQVQLSCHSLTRATIKSNMAGAGYA